MVVQSKVDISTGMLGVALSNKKIYIYRFEICVNVEIAQNRTKYPNSDSPQQLTQKQSRLAEADDYKYFLLIKNTSIPSSIMGNLIPQMDGYYIWIWVK